MAKGMIRLYIPTPYSPDICVPLSPNQQHYLSTVMRCGMGTEIAVFNGVDGEWLAAVEGTKKTLNVRLLKKNRPAPALPCSPLGLLFAPVKRAPIDTLVQKATELGVSWLQPIRTERTIVTRVNEERLLANVIEAAEQSGRMDVPEVRPFLPLFTALLKTGKILFCDETLTAPALAAVYREQHTPDSVWAILIGPEGGFTPKEAATLRTKPNVFPCQLGARILKADTAAIAAIAGWQVLGG